MSRTGPYQQIQGIASPPQKSDAAKIKDLLDQFQEFESIIRDDRKSRGTTNIDSFDAEISALEKKISDYQDRLVSVKKAKDFYEGLPFKMGDVAFHKDYGNVLITGISVHQDNFEESKYAIRSLNGDFRVNVKDLVPITEATKALFGRNK